MNELYLRPFYGEKLRLARMLARLSLEELGKLVGVSRQFLHQLETGAKEPADELRKALEAVLEVTEIFFGTSNLRAVQTEDCHFRRLATAPRSILAQAAARGTILETIVEALDGQLRLPTVNFPEAANPISFEEVEKIAENARRYWGLGLDAPITNMTRVVENAGAVVAHFDDISDRIDALSISRRRPIIVRSSAKVAAVRLRFDLAHEAGHLIMHQGIITGDKFTEGQAHRFASAFLIPRKAFLKEFPRTRRLLDWNGIFTMKLRWGVSVRAILRRAFDLGMIDANQYRTGNIHLTKTGQTKVEKFDSEIKPEQAELMQNALTYLENNDIIGLYGIISTIGMTPRLFKKITNFSVPPFPSNVVKFTGFKL
ncbi:ImmA/IrrE family metallo-endopeptidase [Oecophyllibacter saccharovorans]|uniref:XRE family transcriptional regulator n=1 Tax=Oecophyllibacter saccharovorans TaxID=2558360 RepID=UPI001144D8E4|nr:XRE family transcriptional regulator [Oecophyllibacter saccharovorans]QDH14891.1 ImmA/IrrE family metallo-endopeptidase [Oecophyllibacter saccharovorans]